MSSQSWEGGTAKQLHKQDSVNEDTNIMFPICPHLLTDGSMILTLVCASIL